MTEQEYLKAQALTQVRAARELIRSAKLNLDSVGLARVSVKLVDVARSLETITEKLYKELGEFKDTTPSGT